MINNFIQVFLIVTLGGIITSCQSDSEKGPQSMSNNSLSQHLLTLQQKRIFFGHQSVGVNILDGVKDVLSEHNNIVLNLLSADSLHPKSESFFADAKIGRNTDPGSKCRAFSEAIKRLGGNIDIALMKFCYVDITAGSNIDSVFHEYQSTIESLQKVYPHITFVHVTVPLTARAGGIKQFIKSLLGYKSTNDLDNIARNKFNLLITTRFRDDSIFDLAAIESTYPDGRRESFENEGNVYYSMVRDYTNDGGHLNKTGRRAAAIGLINVLEDAAIIH
jgi:hypothetical protein